MASPFWSEEQRQQFLEQQVQEVDRPADLDRYTGERTSQQQQEDNEEQQLNEPPYAGLGTSLQVDRETRQLISNESATEAGPSRGRIEQTERSTPQLARLEQRVDVSPGRRSYESVPSQASLSVREDAGLLKREIEEQELMPDYSQLPVGPGTTGAVASAGPLEENPGAVMQAMMAQMGTMMNQLLQEQLGPTLNQMMLHQARVESRLEVLENSASRPMSVAGDLGVDRALLDSADQPVTKPEAVRTTGDGRRSDHVHSSSSEMQQVEVASLAEKFASLNREGLDPKAIEHRPSMGRSRSPIHAPHGETPTQGEIIIGGVKHAWSIGASGLQLKPVEPEGYYSPKGVSPGDVFAGRAQSPFEVSREGRSPPKTEPRPGSRTREAVARELRPTASDPNQQGSREQAEKPKELGWIEKGRAELEELLKEKRTQAPKPPEPSRPVTPIKPRIVYPFSPGGTEIRPPPPQRSPKRIARNSPSPPRPPPGTASHHEPNQVEPSSEMRQLAVMLGGAIKGSRGGDNWVEDVKAIPELPKLEIKDSERELSPLIAGDWVTVIGPSLRDLSSNATQWWDEVISASKEFYDKWLTVGPMERLVMVPERPQRFNSGPFTRVEQRAVSLLLKAIPTYIRDDLVSSRKLTSIEALCAILTTYQPGGLRERSALLKYLTSPEPGKNVTETLRGLRRWGRWRLRAHELGIGIPDAKLLVGGLDSLTSTILQQHPDVLFRINTFRHMNNLDHVPTEVSAASLAQFLQAEFQALESGGSAKRVKLAKAQENPETPGPKGKEGKAKGGQKEGKGKSGEKGSSGKSKSCYHWMTPSGCRLGADCRLQHDREQLNNSPDVGSRRYTCSGLGHRSHECTAPSTKPSEGNQGQGNSGNKGKGNKAGNKGDSKGTVAKRVEEDKPTPDTAQLISAAGQLLDQMQVKAIREVLQVNRLGQGESRTGLIDSGASSCRRQAIGDETLRLFKRKVDLAQGTTELYVTPCGTLVSEEPVEAIVALGQLIRIGCRLQWGERECMLWHPTRGRIPLDVCTGCPRIPEAMALELIEEIEAQRIQSVGAAVKAIQAMEDRELPTSKQALANLVSAIERDLEVAPRLGEAVLATWPEIPKPLLRELVAWPKEDTQALPINRRKRKAVAKAKKVLLHLFAGESRKDIEKKGRERGYEVLSIGESEDILAGQTFRYILELAANGKLDAIWAAPPCGTNSLCRFIQPGQPPLRGRKGNSRWGLPGLSVLDQKKVQVSDEMYLRCLIIMLVASEGRKRQRKTPTWNLAENPQDPDEYLAKDAVLRATAEATGGLPSWFATKEFKAAAALLGLQVYTGDQGPYGHSKRKPTGWASSKPLPNLLRGPGVGSEGEMLGNQIGMDQGPQWESVTWAKWAPGMVELLTEQLEISNEEEKVGKVEVDWSAHIAAGHWPPHRRCRTCIAAGAKHRAHKRISSPASWTLSLDTVGPFKRASDETGNNLRFALVACLVVPVDNQGRPVMGPAQEQAQLDQPKEAESVEEVAVDDDTDLGELLGIRAMDEGDWDSEPSRTQEEMEEVQQKCQKDAEGLCKEELECMVPGLRWKEVHFIEILRRKTPQAVAVGISRILSEIRELGFPVNRLHTDAGTEFINLKVRELAAKHDMKHTSAAPQEPSSNGRVESAIGRIKALAKVYLHGPEGDPELWPLALRAAVATMKSESLRSMGFPIPKVVPFGARVQVLTRTWLRRRKQEWHLKARDATVLCPAALVKLGYVVKVGKQLAVVTKLFQGDDPVVKVSLGSDEAEPPVAHSIGPKARVTGKTNIPDMHVSPAPKTRYASKAPAPGRIPAICKSLGEEAAAAEDRAAETLASDPNISYDKVVQFIKTSSYFGEDPENKGPRTNKLERGRHVIFGAFRHGGVVGITNNSKLRPGMAKLITAWARVAVPSATFTTAVLSIDAQTSPHKDSTNHINSSSYWIPVLMPSKGGRLWTEVKQGTMVSGTPMTVSMAGKAIVGQLHDKDRAVQFDPTAWHGTEQWSKNQNRVAILLYTVGCMKNLQPHHEKFLNDLGFVLPQQHKGGGPKDISPKKFSFPKPQSPFRSKSPFQHRQEARAKQWP